MSGVEDRIVEMKFDNAAFERKLGDTIKSLDKLRASLDFAASKRGLDELSGATRNFHLQGMSDGIENVSKGFLAMTTVAVTALAQITSAAFSAGAQFVKAFTVVPVLDGFREMETNMNSIQTILANTDSKGSTLEDVNRALQQLNEYSDKTIYNFGQMAKNIGTFTAAGIDLDTSTAAIKGIANLAAVSGSSAEQASGAMYQLSQALATGTLKLIDWNSVVNSGMGGEVFKSALFETGKALGTIKGVRLDTTFQEWEDAGNNFRESLQDGWITAEVLTNTLQGFTGDLTDAQLAQMGYTEAQISQIKRTGQIATAAATEVKTFSQLIGTVKESIGTGWADSFKIVIGDFAEAKTLFTQINAAIGGVVGRSADSRNKILSDWKALGGRNVLIQGFVDGFAALNAILKPIREAFRTIFPKMTGQRLFELTKGLTTFIQSLLIGKDTAEKIKRVFQGFFGVLEIGWTIIKEGIKFFAGLLGSLSSVGSDVFDFAATTGDTLTDLNKALVEGGGIKKFFEGLGEVIRKPIESIQQFRENVIAFFDALRGGDDSSKGLETVGERFGRVGKAVEAIGAAWAWLAEKTKGVRQALGDLWNYITEWFRELGRRMKAEMNEGDFEGALDIFNVAFLGGIALALRKFFKHGLKLDFAGGLMQKISGMFDQLTGVLKAMQTELKSKALLNIAIALAVLTASLVALSLIDSEALTKALIAMSVGFGELITAMALMNKVTTTVGALKIGILAGAMILLATAATILAAAIKILSGLSWEELAKGLLGVGVGLTAMVTAVNFITTDTGGMIRAGVAMIAIAVAMRILANAMQAFATMGWEEMAKGLIGVAGGLTAITVAMNFMPVGGTLAAGAAMIPLAIGLRILAEAVEAFAEMDWGQMAKGLVGVGIALGIIAGAMNFMPVPNILAAGAAMIPLAIGLRILVEVIEGLGNIDFGTMAKGLGAFAVMLGVLALAMNVMTGTIGGAAALVVLSAAMVVLTQVLKEIAKLSLTELAIGLGGIAAVLAVLGGATAILQPLIPAMLGLGAALSLIGAGFALFGAGAYSVIRAFELLGKTGRKSAQVLIELIAIFMARAPLIGIAIGQVVVEAATELLQAGPTLVKAAKVLLGHLLDTVVDLAPRLAKAVGVLITEILKLIRAKYPDLQKTGYEILTHFLTGVRNNIGRLTQLGIDIVLKFAETISANAQRLVDAGLQILFAFLGAIGQRAGDIVAAGLKLLTDFLSGIGQNIGQVVTAASNIIINFIAALAVNSLRIIQAGANLIAWLLTGIMQNMLKIADVVTNIITTFIIRLGENAGKITTAGANVLVKFLAGITNNVIKVTNAIGTMISQFITAVGNNATKIATAGTNTLIKFLDGVKSNSGRAIDKFAEVGLYIVDKLASKIVITVDKAGDILVKFLKNLRKAIDNHAGEIGDAGRKLAGAMINGITGGLASKAGDVLNSLGGIAKGGLNTVKGIFGIGSPSKVMRGYGHNVIQGFVLGLNDDEENVQSKIHSLSKNVINGFNDSLSSIKSIPFDIDANPTITPVLDLTQVRAGAKTIDGMMASSSLKASVSIDQARTLSVATTSQNGSEEPITPAGPTEVVFNQTINAPMALSTADIYRQTKSQIALAKEELKIA